MSIEKLKKITLYGLSEERELIVNGLQKLGCMHLIPLKQKEIAFHAKADMAEATKEALSYLQACPTKRRIIRHADQSVDHLVEMVLDNKRAMRELSDECDDLIRRIDSVRPWGDFKLPTLEERGNVGLWFYTIPQGSMDALESPSYAYEVVYQDNKFCYVVVLSEEEPDPSVMPVARSHIGTESLSELEAEKDRVEHALDENQIERERLTRWLYLIGQAVARIEDSKTLHEACSGSLDAEQLFLISGWMPQEQEDNVRSFVHEYQLAAMIENTQKDESPPSLIKQGKQTGGGSDTMLFFMTPSYRAWDPGSVLFFSFALFFGMIMNDAMYSLIFGGIVACFHKKMGGSEVGTRVRSMFYFMSAVGVIWGILAGSYFGIEPDPGTFWDKMHVIHMDHYAEMMKLSVIIGAIHIIVANAAVAWNNRNSSHCLANIGWCFLIAGGIFYWLEYLDDINLSFIWARFTIDLAIVFMASGAACILFFESHRPVNGLKSVMMRLLDGVSALWHITGAFGDILSYMRLFALGLAGASLAVTFNDMAKQVLEAFPGIGVVFFVLILLAGHVLNLMLSLMAAFVHGIRLNVIEFFKWALSDEGYPFKPFKKLEEYK